MLAHQQTGRLMLTEMFQRESQSAVLGRTARPPMRRRSLISLQSLNLTASHEINNTTPFIQRLLNLHDETDSSCAYNTVYAI
jgi:hypothetical protein